MDLQQSAPTRRRWYQLEPFGAAFFAAAALAMLTWPAIEAVVGRHAVNRWGTFYSLGFSYVAATWGQRLPLRVLVAAMVVLWSLVFWMLARAA
jgi:hypothetical protein